MRRFALLASTRVRAAARPRRGTKRKTAAKAGASARRARPAGSGADYVPPVLRAIVGLGSSAGGLDALTKFFSALPSDSGMAFVLVQHLDPTHGSFMAELVGRSTAMPVVQVQADTPVEADHVYCIPPGRYLSIHGRTLRLTAPVGTGAAVRMPIDFFLRALAADVQEHAIGIVVSGTGSDGTLGLRAIRASGGLAIAQDPVTAQHDGMPCSAIAAGVVDHVVSPEQMPGLLLAYLRHPYARGAGSSPPAAEVAHDHLHDLLALLRERTHFDFRAYKRSTLERRIGRRMSLKHVEDIADYVRILTDEPAEATRLFEDLLISVTSFFRDPEAWLELQERVIRPLVERKDLHVPLRVWVPGCATGEEAYSVAMLLIEELQAARKSVPLHVFASDVDAGALDFARIGLYPESVVADVPRERRRRFFLEEDHSARVSKELRESVVFARQNLVTDPPYSNLDLISCRNVLMYFEPPAQKKILSLLHFALAEGGHLFLGAASGIGQQEDLFEVLSPKWRIFRRVGSTRHDRVQLPAVPESVSSQLGDIWPDRSGGGRLGALARQLLLERFAPACVLINRRYEILYFAGPTHDYLVQPTGVPTQDLMSRARDGLQTKLRAALRGALKDGQRVVIGAHVRRGDGWHRVQLTVEPLKMSRGTDGLLLVSFVDEPRVASAPEVPGAPGELEEPVGRQLEDELRTTREDLQGTIGELESSNQELKVANEEIMSVNEELRSSNEELETSKEELNSLNEELGTVNTELKDKVTELERTNNDLDNLLTSTNIATIFLDTTFRVRRFTPVATRLFNLIASDVGRPITDLAQRCVDPDLLHDAELVLARHAPVSKEVLGRDGRWYVRQVLPYRTHDDRIDGVVITFSDVAAEALQEARLYAEAIVDTVREPLVVLDTELRVQSANRAFYETFGLVPDATVNRFVYELGDRRQDTPTLPQLLVEILRDRGPVTNVEVEHEFPKSGRKTMLLNARVLARGGGRPDLILLAIEDITDRKRAEQTLRESEAMTRAGVRTAVDGIVTIDERGTVLSFNPAAEQIFGYPGGEVIGQAVGMLSPEAEQDKHGDVASYFRTGDPKLTGPGREIRGRRKDGTIFPIDLHVSAFDDGVGRRFVGTIRDISERKRMEEQGRQHQAELAHVLRVATIEHLAAGLAHELNQPLTAIANDVEACATYVRAGKREPRRLLTLLERAGAEALRAGEIVHHLREFVQRSPARLEPLDLRSVVRNATHWLIREMENAQITLRLELSSQQLPVIVDRIQIEQVIVNLVQNAIDAIREETNQNREIRIHAWQTEDGMAEVAIDDTGIGFPAGTTELLYEPFFTTKPQGMGMGLAISRSIAEMHHGRLSVAPRASGGGTTVRLALPLRSET